MDISLHLDNKRQLCMTKREACVLTMDSYLTQLPMGEKPFETHDIVAPLETTDHRNSASITVFGPARKLPTTPE